MTLTHICFDADDTLWENLKYFHETEAAVASMVSEFVTPEQMEAHTLAVEKRNIPIMGFGVLSFICSLVEAAIEVSDGAIRSAQISEILAMGRSMLDHPVELLDGVEDVLQNLAPKYQLVMITKGAVRHQERKIAASGLAPYFDVIRIVEDKRPKDYTLIFNALNVDPSKCLMIGNSMKSDVVSPIEAGAYGVYLQHEREWAVEHADRPSSDRFTEISAISALPELIKRINANHIV